MTAPRAVTIPVSQIRAVVEISEDIAAWPGLREAAGRHAVTEVERAYRGWILAELECRARWDYRYDPVTDRHWIEVTAYGIDPATLPTEPRQPTISIRS